MNVDQAMKVILKPYITEKTFAMVENESKICFIVDRSASKPQISEAVKALYNEKVTNVNTARTIYGKKAFVQFEKCRKSKRFGYKDRNAIIWIIKLQEH